MTIDKNWKYILLTAVLIMFCLSQSSCDDGFFLEKRCEATTKNGEPCRYKAVKNSKYCRIHRKSTKKRAKATSKKKSYGKCKAKTKDGSRCSRKANKSGYCKQHYKKNRR